VLQPGVSHFVFGEDAFSSVAKSRSKSPNSKKAPAERISASAAKLRLLKRLRCTLKFEKLVWASGAQLIAGVDEVGRGSLFGPVVAAAVILDPAYRIRGLRDSKLLPAERREELALRIREHSIAWAIAAVAMSMTIGVFPGRGQANEIGLVPKMGFRPPCGATNGM